MVKRNNVALMNNIAVYFCILKYMLARFELTQH